NIIIVKTGRAVIAVGGAYETLSEIGHALSGGVPVVGLRTLGLIPGDVAPDSSIPVAENALEAVEMAVEAANTRELKGS
ncbi:MAG: TIGR00725 family protein, partial [SAR202 cluster bacterium]|nr:TIGR00725 family protein [SAR202 cluster bacterium]